jgi:branched-chain amino acid transport system substrate-binding protein
LKGTGTAVRLVLVAFALAGLLAACSESAPSDEAGGPDDSSGSTESTLRGPLCDTDITVAECLDGRETTIGVIPEEPPSEADGEPIRLGMINQENTAGGSFPELRLADEAGIEFINTELGGIDGRPLELVSCVAEFSVESSQACAQEMVSEDVEAVLGGIDIFSTGSIPVLEDNGIPFIGGIPVGSAETVSENAFIFSGGSPGAMAAFADYAIDELEAETVSVAYADFESISNAATQYGVAQLEAAGVEVREVEFGVLTTDFLPVITQAAEGEPDAIIVAAADTACAPIMRTVEDLQVDSQLFLVGACVAPEILDEVGDDAAEGTIFNVEGLLQFPQDSLPAADTDLYIQVIEDYGDGLDWAGAGTVSFRALMNLYNVLVELGPDDISPESITAAFQEKVDEPSFNGHPYTCDGEQVPDLPALCSPQQVLGQREAGSLTQVSDGWIDVPAIVAALPSS